MVQDLGADLTRQLEEACLAVYEKCYNYAYDRGIIIADTKLEFGLDEAGDLVLADEVLTPDSSRFWNKAEYQVGTSPLSYDKQYLRDWLHRQQAGPASPPPRTCPPKWWKRPGRNTWSACSCWCPRSKTEKQQGPPSR